MKNEIPKVDPTVTSGEHISYWLDSTDPISFQPLKKNTECDVVIVGGGIAGLSVAYNCASRGLHVVVVEDGNIGSGESGRTSAHLVNSLDDRYFEIERIFGEDGARLAAESHSAAIDFIENTSREENINCEFKRVSGYLFSHPSDDEKNLDKEFEAATKAGVNVRWLDEVPVIKSGQKPCIEFVNQGQFHPLKYLKGLADAIFRKNGEIYTSTHVKKVDETGVMTNDDYKVSAKHIVVATNSPINNKYVMHLKQYAYRTYIIGATVPKGSIPFALWWDTGDVEANKDIPPYHYVRLEEYNDQYDLLIVGGEDHPTGLPEAQETTEISGYSKLEGWTRGNFNIEDVVYRWSGQVLEPMDSLGYIGRNPMDKDNIYIVTGDSGNGLTHGTIAGLLITGLIIDNTHPWEKIYRPSRTNFLKSGKSFIIEFFGGLMQYLKHSPRHADEVKLSDIKTNEARIIEIERDKFGAYRDANDDLHVVSATCTHLGCIVKWNEDEKSWDCPCHGSRFNYKGEVLNGPAIKNLLYYKEEAAKQEPA
jgi:glycine/D-amino acid oxidase-like deaminating enzyme/nitrite reductase/ring-hydroxylating ferredoxin subunit